VGIIRGSNTSAVNYQPGQLNNYAFDPSEPEGLGSSADHSAAALGTHPRLIDTCDTNFPPQPSPLFCSYPTVVKQRKRVLYLFYCISGNLFTCSAEAVAWTTRKQLLTTEEAAHERQERGTAMSFIGMDDVLNDGRYDLIRQIGGGACGIVWYEATVILNFNLSGFTM